ncbi:MULTISPECIES: class A sortase [Bacillati]|uniref:class A sortase n=1 Tax=Bacillati TaxID=1783272 RepID=UPI0036E1A3CE
MNRQKFFRAFSYLLILTGLVLLVLPQLNYIKIGQRTDKNNIIAEKVSAEEMQKNLRSKTSFDFYSIEETSTSGTWLSSEYIDKNLIIGRLYIPSIEANLTVFNGVTNPILHAGVGTMRPDLSFGEGNIPIAGHYAKDKNILFGNLTAVEIGDKIYLTDNETVYEYEVYETRTVEVTEVKWIEDTVAKEHGKPIISLMNCYYVNGQNTGDRYFVFGELLNTHTIEDSVFN